ncbi:MAG: four helix bundle protein [Cyclobacteriaceae bacterium]|nr:four helix bundle protein [Cyclobacteriaceae bacterium]
MAAGTFRDLTVYKKAFALAMEIYEISKEFPKEERYSLTDQIRRSSRSVCVNVGEGYRKRQYPAHFVSKASDADMENTETRIWLDFAYASKYFTDDIKQEMESKAVEVGKLLNHMIENPEKYARKK